VEDEEELQVGANGVNFNEGMSVRPPSVVVRYARYGRRRRGGMSAFIHNKTAIQRSAHTLRCYNASFTHVISGVMVVVFLRRRRCLPRMPRDAALARQRRSGGVKRQHAINVGSPFHAVSLR